MKTIKYDKLVRDKIPEIIEKSGKKCVVEVMDKETYIQHLDRKLNEELAEYQSDKSIEELDNVRKEKAANRGGFEKRLLLKEVIEDAD